MPFIIFGLILGAIGVPFAWFFSAILSVMFASDIKSAFIDSYMMIRTMVSYMSVAPSTEITVDIYGKLSNKQSVGWRNPTSTFSIEMCGNSCYYPNSINLNSS